MGETPLLLVWTLMVACSRVRAHDLCQRCQCLPLGRGPTQAICRDDGSTDKAFYPATTEDSESLELVYIYGMSAVTLEDGALVTRRPVTLLVQNCTEVSVSAGAVSHLQTLVVSGATRVTLEALPQHALWATLLEDIGHLTTAAANLAANYSVSIRRVGSLILHPGGHNDTCQNNLDFVFTLSDSDVGHVPKGGLSVCGGHITVTGNTFHSVSKEGFQLTAEGSITLIGNIFGNLSKQAFNLSSPETYISGNHFQTLPAGALRGVSTVLDTFFTNNTVEDVDLGGVLLDMGWDMVIEHNTVACDCASKRTSILNPKEDMLFLTNSSFQKLENIFLFNFCDLNCSVTLKAFSYALTQGEVCATNDTRLQHDQLCNISIIPDVVSTTELDGFFVSAASKAEIIVPLVVIVVTILLASSLCYGCREMYAFRFTFRPNTDTGSKVVFQK